MMTYQIIKDATGKDCGIVRSDGWSIPFAEDNTDYQAFLKYQAEGGKVYGADEEVPADEVTG